MKKNAKSLGFSLEIITEAIVKRNAETTTETQPKQPFVLDKSSILKAAPTVITKKPLSGKRITDIIKGLENIIMELNSLMAKIKLENMDKKSLQNEIEVIRKNLRKIIYDDDRLSTIEEIKDKHMQLKSRLHPIKGQ